MRGGRDGRTGRGAGARTTKKKNINNADQPPPPPQQHHHRGPTTTDHRRSSRGGGTTRSSRARQTTNGTRQQQQKKREDLARFTPLARSPLLLPNKQLRSCSWPLRHHPSPRHPPMIGCCGDRRPSRPPRPDDAAAIAHQDQQAGRRCSPAYSYTSPPRY